MSSSQSPGIVVGNMSVVVPHLQRSDAGDYTCTAHNSEGSTRSNPLHINIIREFGRPRGTWGEGMMFLLGTGGHFRGLGLRHEFFGNWRVLGDWGKGTISGGIGRDQGLLRKEYEIWEFGGDLGRLEVRHEVLGHWRDPWGRHGKAYVLSGYLKGIKEK